ncbi:Uracil-DNA glycosylase [Streptomyces rimosus subsp. rimosus]
MTDMLPESWRGVLGEELEKPYFKELTEFVEQERAKGPVYPPREEVFAALDATPYDQVKVLILGQDPYHGEGQGHGLCFSVRPGVKTPPSLRNIYKEMKEELGHPVPDNGYLMPWARQGVLLLNAVLTVRAGEANSHKGKGWEKFTDAVIKAVASRPDPAVSCSGQLREEEAAADRHRAARGRGGRPPVPAVRQEILRIPALHPDQRGGRGAGAHPDRLAYPRPGLNRGAAFGAHGGGPAARAPAPGRPDAQPPYTRRQISSGRSSPCQRPYSRASAHRPGAGAAG